MKFKILKFLYFQGSFSYWLQKKWSQTTPMSENFKFSE